MTMTLAMHEQSLHHIRDRLDALKLDCKIITFDDTGQFMVDGTTKSPELVDIDYLWVSVHISRDEIRETAFNTILACRSVGVLQTFNAGLDNPFYKKIANKGTVICNSSAQAIAIAEYVLAQALNVIHPVDQQRQQQRDLSWQKTPFREMSRMTWLIVGYGPIGQEIAKRAKAFEAKTIVIRRSAVASDHVDTVGTTTDLPDLLPNADVIVLACPLNNATQNMADAAFFKRAKPGAVLINIARGGLIDEAALIDSLDQGGIDTAVLDVFHTEPLPADDPLWTHPKVRITSHTSFNGDGVHDRWDQLFLENVQRYANDEALDRIVAPSDLV